MTADIVHGIDAVTAPVCGWCQTELRADCPSLDYCSDSCQYEWQRLRGDALVGYREPDDLAAHVFNQHEAPNVEVTLRPRAPARPSLRDRFREASERAIERLGALDEWTPIQDAISYRMTHVRFRDIMLFSLASPVHQIHPELIWEIDTLTGIRRIPHFIAREAGSVTIHSGAMTQAEIAQRIADQFNAAAERISYRYGLHTDQPDTPFPMATIPAMTELTEVVAAGGQGLLDACRRVGEELLSLAQVFSVADRTPVDPRARTLEVRRHRNTGPMRLGRAPQRIDARGTR